MEEERLDKLLNKLADATKEPVRAGLAEDIKGHIPQRLAAHRGGMDTIKIMIDLRIGRLAAVAIIIITLILSITLLGGRASMSDGVYQDSKLLVKYCLGGGNASSEDVLAGISGFYDYLVHQGREVTYYADNIDPKDGNTVLMHWKLYDGRYRVIFVDLHAETISAEQLIELQAKMLQKKTK